MAAATNPNTSIPDEGEYEEYDPMDGAPYSWETHQTLTLVIKTILSGSFGIFGVFTNTVNFILFYKQSPLSSSAVVILTSLAVSDFWVCAVGTWAAVLGVLYGFYDTSTWSWAPRMFSGFTAARPLNFITQVTCWYTTFMAVERAVSVLFPFKVKSIFTPKRSVVCVVSMAVIIFIIHVPDMFETYPGLVRLPGTNNLTQVQFLDNPILAGSRIQVWYFYLSPVVLRFLSIFLVVVSNIVIFWKVNLSQKFRASKANATNAAALSDMAHAQQGKSSKTSGGTAEGDHQNNSNSNSSNSKEMKLLRMITVISVVFTFCYFLNIIQTIRYRLVYTNRQYYHWSEQNIVWDSAMLFQIFNSSINICIYYNMSSRFRNDFNAMFCGRKQT